MSNCCVICYRPGPTWPSNPNPKDNLDGLGTGTTGLRVNKLPNFGNAQEEEVMRRYFNLLERYLNDGHGQQVEEEGRKSWKFPLEEVIKIGMTSCPECLMVMGSFCKLYEELKRIELLLNWKVWTVKNLMTSAQRVPRRVEHFREKVRKLKLEGSSPQQISGDEMVDLVMRSKKAMICKCSSKLESAFPKLSIVRWNGGVSTVEITSNADNHGNLQQGNFEALAGPGPSVENNYITDFGGKAVETPVPVTRNNSKSFCTEIESDTIFSETQFTEEAMSTDLEEPVETAESDPDPPESPTLTSELNCPSISLQISKEIVKEETLPFVAIAERLRESSHNQDKYPLNFPIGSKNTSSDSCSQENIPDPAPDVSYPANLNITSEETNSLTPATAITRRSLRTIIRCNQCLRTFSSKIRLTDHQVDCGVELDDADVTDNDNCDGEYGDPGDPDTTDTSDDSGDGDSDEEFSCVMASDNEVDPTNLSSDEEVEENIKQKKLVEGLNLTIGTKNRNVADKSENLTEGLRTKEGKRTDNSNKKEISKSHGYLSTEASTSSNEKKRRERTGMLTYRFKCPECPFFFLRLHSLLLHYKDTHDQFNSVSNTPPNDNTIHPTIKTDILGFNYSWDVPTSASVNSINDLKFKTFARIEVRNKLHICPLSTCNRSFYFSQDLDAHSRLHGEFKCELCDVVKEYAPYLAMHELEHHLDHHELPPPWNCIRCNLEFPTKAKYICHHLTSHLNLPFVDEDKCAICGGHGESVVSNYTKLICHYKRCHDLNRALIGPLMIK